MHPQVLASCANCWHNALQHGAVGLSMGFCTEQRVVLLRAEETTCARHLRKDLLLDSAQMFSDRHQQVFTCAQQVQKLSDQEPVSGDEHIAASAAFIRHDKVGEAVADYGEYGTKIESLAQLHALDTFRAELAMLTLGRAYVRRCTQRGGQWTSGLHLLWWTKRRLQVSAPPEPEPSDLRYQTTGSLERQVELASWSLMMSRLVFLSDIGAYAVAEDDPVARLRGIAEQAAAETEIPGKKRLLSWIKKRGLPLVEEALSERRYRKMASALHESAALA